MNLLKKVVNHDAPTRQTATRQHYSRILWCVFLAAQLHAGITPTRLTCEYLENPLVDMAHPRRKIYGKFATQYIPRNVLIDPTGTII